MAKRGVRTLRARLHQTLLLLTLVVGGMRSLEHVIPSPRVPPPETAALSAPPIDLPAQYVTPVFARICKRDIRSATRASETTHSQCNDGLPPPHRKEMPVCIHLVHSPQHSQRLRPWALLALQLPGQNRLLRRLRLKAHPLSIREVVPLAVHHRGQREGGGGRLGPEAGHRADFRSVEYRAELDAPCRT